MPIDPTPNSGATGGQALQTVRLRDNIAGRAAFLEGTQSCDRDHANLFCVWQNDEEVEEDPLWGSGGAFIPASKSDPVGLEVEVHFSFADMEDVSDHAEVYWWEVFECQIQDGAPLCQRVPYGEGEYVVEAGGIHGPDAIYQPVVSKAVEWIQNARWNQVETPPSAVGS
ncbi:MAG: hypothetical protein EOO38_22325 [Cytophagaceae bacterium]|nr:MAG: hypothetical protein EOO38_22325 [Cytophagaceae bacterium]